MSNLIGLGDEADTELAKRRLLLEFCQEQNNLSASSYHYFIIKVRQNNKLVSSVITCTEYLVVPYRANNRPSINIFWELIKDCSIDLYPITQPIAEKAAEIRAAYKFKTMDSLQLAVACMGDCDLFLTNDKQLRQFQEIPCITVAEWEG